MTDGVVGWDDRADVGEFGTSEGPVVEDDALGTVGRGATKSVFFDIALPYSAAPIVFDADVTTSSSDTNAANDSAQHTATPLTYLVVNGLKKAEGVDVYDEGTDFNPFGREAPRP